MKRRRRYKLRCEVGFQGSVSLQGIAVTFSREEWQQPDLTQKNLYLDVTLDKYCNVMSVGHHQVPTPEVIVTVEQAEEPCTLDSEISSHSCRDGDIGFETSQDRPSGEFSFQPVETSHPIDTPDSASEELQKDSRQRGRYDKKQPKPSMAAQAHRRSSTHEDTGKMGHIETHLVPARKRSRCSDSCVKSLKVHRSVRRHNRNETENCDKRIRYGDTLVDMNSHREVNICEGCWCWELLGHMHAVTQHEGSQSRRNLHLFPDYGQVSTHKPPVSTHQSISAEEKQRGYSKRKTVLTPNSPRAVSEGIYAGGKPNLCTKLGKDFPHKSRQQDTHKASHRKCPGCGSTFIHRSELPGCQTKYTEGKPHKHNECGQTSEGSNLSIYIKNCTMEKPFECTECGKMFTRKSVLRMQQKIQTEEKPYVCTECGKAFTRKSQFLTHKGFHTGEKPSVGTECGKVFTQKATVILHQKFPTRERSYVCTECGQAFDHGSNLIKHQKIHNGEKPYKCSDCGKFFTWKTGLRQKCHMGERHYECRECRKTFIRKSILQTHQRSHKGEKPYVCLECGKAFFHKSHFITHERIHTREKLYRCGDCGKSFTMKSQLHVQQQSHMGKKPYRCVECGKAFTDGSNLLAH